MVNKSDSKQNTKSLGGIFFMALTLVLVSFACTGPIVGTVLIKSTSGEFWAPIVTMFAFAVAFALPFAIFAFFPNLLQSLPKSGGWLTSVKVVLGFIEVALGFKFLSVADQTYHWHLLDREVYLGIWIVCFTLLGLYLLGKIRFNPFTLFSIVFGGKLCHAHAEVIPEHSSVANAIGAVVADVSARATVEIRSGFGPDGQFAYTIHASDRMERYEDYGQAVEAAGAAAKQLAIEEARRRGALGELSVEAQVDPHRGRDRHGAEVDLGTTVTACASGRLRT